MAEFPSFCPHPGDPEGCAQALAQAAQEKRLAEHCVMEGLRSRGRQCHDVLLDGLTRAADASASSPAPATDPGGPVPLKNACEEALQLGYRAGIASFQTLLYEAYDRLIWRIALQEKTPNDLAEDIHQEVSMALHRYLRGGGSIMPGYLRGYIASATVREWCRQRKKARTAFRGALSGVSEDQEDRRPPPRPATAPLSLDTVERLREYDQQWAVSAQGGLISRVLLTHMGLGGLYTTGKCPPREIRADWQRLGSCSDLELAVLHARAVEKARRDPAADAVALAADLINAGDLEFWQVAIAFAVAAGRDLPATRQLITELSHESPNAIGTRVCRLRHALRPPATGDGPDGEARSSDANGWSES